MVLKDHLASLGYNVVGESKDISDFIEKYEGLRPNIVVVDSMIPGLDGVAAITRLLALDAEAKVIMVVASGQRGLAMQALSAGAKDFVVKPVNFQQLRKALLNAA